MEIDALSLPQTFSVSRLHSSLPPFTLTHGINALLRRRQRQLPWETVMNSCSHHTSTDAILLTADCWLLPAEERESCSSVNTIKQAAQLSFPPDQLSEVSSIAPLRDGVCSRMGSAAAAKDWSEEMTRKHLCCSWAQDLAQTFQKSLTRNLENIFRVARISSFLVCFERIMILTCPSKPYKHG